MDREEPHSSYQSSAKNPKRNDENDGVESSAVVTGNPTPAVNVQQTGDIFKLDIDCFEEVFDYLPMEDLVSVGKACKRLQQAAGYCYQQNYYFDDVSIDSDDSIEVFDELTKKWLSIAHFVPSIRKIHISFTEQLQYFLNIRSKFHRLKQIKLEGLEFTEVEVKQLITTTIWKNLEILRVTECELDNNFHEAIDLCSKLTHLIIDDECTSESNWSNCKYPTLEYFKIIRCISDPPKGIPMFLELNSNIRKFVTDAYLFLQIRDEMLASNVKLDELAITIFKTNECKLESMCDLLNELYSRGFYRKLGLVFPDISRNQEQINCLKIVNGLTKLAFSDPIEPLRISSLKNLEELYIDKSRDVADFVTLPNELAKLKLISFGRTSVDDILPFIRRSVEMQKMLVINILPGVHFNQDKNVIDLRALNREREQLLEAQKIVIYVKEKIYLATKWALGETDFGLIQLKRLNSITFEDRF